MKINSKLARMKLFLPNRGLFVLLTSAIFFFMSSSISFAPTKKVDDPKFSKTKSINFAEKRLMSDSELSEANAQAFFNITQFSGYGSQNVIHVDLNARVDIVAHVDSFKMGYYDSGWDYEATNFYFGGSDQYTNANTVPLVFNGIFLEMGFDNIGSASDRKLNYIDFGTASANGPVTGTFVSLNALMANAGTGQNGGVLKRQNLAGRETLIFANEPLTFLFSAKYDYTPPGGSTTHDLVGIFQKIPNQTPKLGY